MYFKIPQHVVKGGRVVKRRMGDLTDLLSTDTTLTTPDINFSVDTSQLPLPTIPTVSGPDAASGATGGGFSLTDFFNSLTSGAQAATAIYSAADLISINQQRAARGMLPINQYGQIGTAVTPTKSITGSLGLSLPVLLLIGGGVLFFALRNR